MTGLRDRVARSSVLLALAGAWFCFAACNGPRALAFFEEAYWVALAGPGVVLEQRLGAVAEAAGFRLELVVVTSADPRAELAALLVEPKHQLVLLTPLLSLQAAAIAASSPDVRFIAIDGAAAPDPRLTLVRFDAAAAMERSGRAVARYVVTLTGARVATIAGAGRSGRAGEHFARGFVDEAGQSRIVQRELQASSDRVRLRRLIEGVVRDGARVLFLDVGNLSSIGLAVIRDQEALVVTRNWGERAGYEDTILLSVDDDIVAAFSAGIDAGRGAEVEVTARVVWGLAAELPSTAQPLIDAVRDAVSRAP